MAESSATPRPSKRRAMAAPAGYSPWSDLHGDLLQSIAATAGVSLRDYATLRGVCAAWRSALAPLSYPCLLSLTQDFYSHSASAFSLPMRRSFHLHTESSAMGDHGAGYGRARVVGSGNGRFAIAIERRVSRSGGDAAAFLSCSTRRIFLVDPRAGKKVRLPSPTKNDETKNEESVRKIVFAPNPPSHNDDHWTAVALYGSNNKVSYIDTDSSISTEDKKWTTVNVHGERCYTDMAFHPGGDKVYFLDSCGGVHVLGMPSAGQPARIKPLATLIRGPKPTAAYAPPYDVVFSKMVMRHIFFCHGTMYQLWKNTNATVKLAGGKFRICADEIFVLRYSPERWPSWGAVKDLGGCSVFIGKTSSPVVVRPGTTVPDVRADCVYWIDHNGAPMVCDIATGASTPWVLPCGALKGDCWYFGHDDMMMSNNGDERNMEI